MAEDCLVGLKIMETDIRKMDATDVLVRDAADKLISDTFYSSAFDAQSVEMEQKVYDDAADDMAAAFHLADGFDFSF
ncbi:hypothetical protein HKCCE3408_01050 [Rhodobacterales bacterium HKCCE3408]|nr:hypothetical protein [Rhodobacterales bacterium HKCCE3408]